MKKRKNIEKKDLWAVNPGSLFQPAIPFASLLEDFESIFGVF